MSGRFPEPEQIFEDKYRVERLLGSGGFARVYLAEQVDLGRKVAIKILSLRVRPSAPADSADDAANLELIARRFEREARIISQLNSAQTITIYDYGRTAEGLLYMVMEYVDGVELGEIPGPIAPRRALKILRQVLLSLREAHARDLLHRDLKPANIMVYEYFGQKDQVKLLDFGIAKAIGEVANGAGADLTATDSLVGTPRYMSPEQIRGHEMGPASDIYSLGLVFYELLMGTKAITNTDSIEILAKHLSSESFRIPRDDIFHPQLVRLVNKMLCKDLEGRYRSTDEVLADLDQLEQLSGDLRLNGPPQLGLAGSFQDDSSIVELEDSFIEAVDPGFIEAVDDFEFEMDAGRPRSARRALALTVLLVLVLMGAGVALWPSKKPAADAQASALALETGERMEPVEPVDEAGEKPLPVVTLIRTRPTGASVWAGERLMGMAPVQFDAAQYDFPLIIRATSGEHSIEKTLTEPGGEIWLDIPVPEDAAKPGEVAAEERSDVSAKKRAPSVASPPRKPAPQKPAPSQSVATKPPPPKAPAKTEADTLKYLPLE